MSDLIDRQEAIEALDFEIVHMMVFSNDEKNITNPFTQYNKGLEDGIKAIRGLPSAEPERIAAAPWNPDRNRHCCDSCGAYIGKYDKYCNGCGARLTDWTPDGRRKRK